MRRSLCNLNTQVEGQNAYQFCIQPPDAPAFVGNSVCLLCSFFQKKKNHHCILEFFLLLFS